MNTGPQQSNQSPQQGGSEETPSQDPGYGDSKPPTPKTCTSCDLGEIEELACTAKKFARQAEVINETATDLETYRTQFDGARKKYTEAREAADLDLTAIRKVLDELAEQLRCRLTDTQRDCLEQATTTVLDDIDACSEPPGCQSPCDDSEIGDLVDSGEITELTAEIARRRDNLAKSAAYFTALIAEPDDIAKEVAALKAEATKLAADVAAGGDITKVVRWYARWLILDRSAEMSKLGRGFESVAAYIDCLCSVLRCLVSGWTAVAVLEGRKAELECHEAAKQKVCEKKKADPLQAILTEYEECCKEAEASTDEGRPAQAI